jgi:hypothetical protein
VASKAKLRADLSNQLTPPSTVLLEKLIVAQLQQKYQHFMEFRTSLQPVTRPHHYPDQSHSQLRIQFLSIQAKMTLSRSWRRMGSEEIAPILPDAGIRWDERLASLSAAYPSAWSLLNFVWILRRKDKTFGPVGIDPPFLAYPACSLVIWLRIHFCVRSISLWRVQVFSLVSFTFLHHKFECLFSPLPCVLHVPLTLLILCDRSRISILKFLVFESQVCLWLMRLDLQTWKHFKIRLKTKCVCFI